MANIKINGNALTLEGDKGTVEVTIKNSDSDFEHEGKQYRSCAELSKVLSEKTGIEAHSVNCLLLGFNGLTFSMERVGAEESYVRDGDGCYVLKCNLHCQGDCGASNFNCEITKSDVGEIIEGEGSSLKERCERCDGNVLIEFLSSIA